MLLTGTTGVGKSLVAASALDGLREHKGALPFSISFSARTSAGDTQVREAAPTRAARGTLEPNALRRHSWRVS